MANLTVTRTYVCSIQNHRQVSDGLDSLGDSASKIWNVARWTADRIWDATGEIPNGVCAEIVHEESVVLERFERAIQSESH